jgi:hypothetical protein
MPDKLLKQPRDPVTQRLIDIAIGKLNTRERKQGKEPAERKAGAQNAHGKGKPK